jgi:hypothetical protein
MYSIEKDGVYCYDTLIKGADPASFEILSEHFARDARAVYVQRQRYDDADPASFEILSEPDRRPTQFARDRRHVYKTNRPAIIKDLNGAEFRVLDRHYGCDRTCVYALDAESVLKKVSPDTFRTLGDGFAVADDASIRLGTGPSTSLGTGRVFYRGRKVGGANAATFRVIGPGVGADARAVFSNEFKELGLDPAGIEAIGGNYFRAPHGVLHGVGLVEGADAASLVVLADDYAKDRRAVFFRRQPIPDADVDTFVPLDAFYSKDARRGSRSCSRCSTRCSPTTTRTRFAPASNNRRGPPTRSISR